MVKPKSPTKTPNKLQRKEVVEFAENNSTMTHAVIAEKFGQQFGMRISKQI